MAFPRWRNSRRKNPGSQYSGTGTGTSFDNATGVQTSPNFGAINGVRPPRLIQLSLKVYF